MFYVNSICTEHYFLNALDSETRFTVSFGSLVPIDSLRMADRIAQTQLLDALPSISLDTTTCIQLEYQLLNCRTGFRLYLLISILFFNNLLSV